MKQFKRIFNFNRRLAPLHDLNIRTILKTSTNPPQYPARINIRFCLNIEKLNNNIFLADVIHPLSKHTCLSLSGESE